MIEFCCDVVVRPDNTYSILDGNIYALLLAEFDKVCAVHRDFFREVNFDSTYSNIDRTSTGKISLFKAIKVLSSDCRLLVNLSSGSFNFARRPINNSIALSASGVVVLNNVSV